MELYRFEGKRVHLTDSEGEEFEGVVGDYIYPDDNEPEGVEAIVLDYSIRGDGYKYKNPVLFNAPDIKSIELIQIL